MPWFFANAENNYLKRPGFFRLFLAIAVFAGIIVASFGFDCIHVF
jgi:hypothetical protein